MTRARRPDDAPPRNHAGMEPAAVSLAKNRLLFATLIFLVFYLAIGLRLVDLTLLRDAALPAGQVQNSAALKAHVLRGSILDRNGELVATSLPAMSVYADTTIISDPAEVAAQLSPILGHKKAALEKKLSSGRKFIWIQRRITPNQQYAINALGHPGIGFHEEERRIYPNDRLMSHLVGYTDVDGNGIAGLERAYQQQLAAGEEPLILTIDLRVQHILHREMGAAMKKHKAKAATGVVMDVRTGDIIAAVSLPDFDPYRPNEFSAAALFNLYSLGVFEMGSTFKIFSTAAALEYKSAHFGSTYDAAVPVKYGRHTISDNFGKKRILTLAETFIYSSNIGTVRMALKTGTQKLRQFYDKLGFFEAVPLTLPERGRPLVPKPWRDIHTMTASFGHGIAVTPLHLIRGAAALVNGGTLVRPRFVRDDKAEKAVHGEQVISADTSRKMRQLLELTVVHGTGRRAQIDGYRIGGKTGTAEKTGGGSYNRRAVLSSFIGFFPIAAPQYAVLTILDEPQEHDGIRGSAGGGWTAAPVAARIIEQMAPLYQIPPDARDGATPITRTMSAYLRDDKKGTSHVSATTH